MSQRETEKERNSKQSAPHLISQVPLGTSKVCLKKRRKKKRSFFPKSQSTRLLASPTSFAENFSGDTAPFAPAVRSSSSEGDGARETEEHSRLASRMLQEDWATRLSRRGRGGCEGEGKGRRWGEKEIGRERRWGGEGDREGEEAGRDQHVCRISQSWFSLSLEDRLLCTNCWPSLLKR